MSTNTKTSNTLPIVKQTIYNSGPYVVSLWAGDCSNVKLAKQDGMLDLYGVSVSVSAVNRRDLDEMEKFAHAILAACKKARQLNKQRGL